MHTYTDILDNTLESMLADAEDNGRDGIQPMLTTDDVKIILDALRRRKPVMKCVVASGEEALRAKQSELADTAEGMVSSDYKERFRAEYAQTKIRYERLKAFNTRIEAACRTADNYTKGDKVVEMPKHDCPRDLLIAQQRTMGEYLHILEVRAVIENIDL